MDTSTSFESPARKLAFDVLQIVFKHRRSLEDAHEERHSCEECQFPHLDRIESAIVTGLPIHFVLPAFPAKSPNLKKVLGHLPDKADMLALNFLKSLCDQIGNLHEPGAQITICSDGRVFSDVVGVSDNDVTEYHSVQKFFDWSIV